MELTNIEWVLDKSTFQRTLVADITVYLTPELVYELAGEAGISRDEIASELGNRLIDLIRNSNRLSSDD